MTHIRNARESDIVRFKEIIEASILELCKDFYTQEQIEALLKQYPSPALYKKWLWERVLIVAENDDEVIGFAQYDPCTNSIEAVHVSPDHTCLGTGRNLVSAHP